MSINVKDLSFCYNRGTSLQRDALVNVSFSIDKGEFVLIGGEVGCGKTTLLRHMNGLLRPHSGSVTVDGLDAGNKKIKSKVGLLLQHPQKQLFAKTVYEDIAFAPSNIGFKDNELKDHVRYAMGLTGIDGSISSVSPFSLSGGEMRLVALAGVMAMKPEYLLLDEPTSGLDPENRSMMLKTLKELQASGVTIIIVSHQISEMISFAEKIMMLNSGSIDFIGTPKEYIFSTSSSLQLPDITSLMKDLKTAGMDVSEDVFSVDDALLQIKKALLNVDGKRNE